MILKDLPNGIGAGTTELKVLRPFSNTLDREYLLFSLKVLISLTKQSLKELRINKGLLRGI